MFLPFACARQIPKYEFSSSSEPRTSNTGLLLGSRLAEPYRVEVPESPEPVKYFIRILSYKKPLFAKGSFYYAVRVGGIFPSYTDPARSSVLKSTPRLSGGSGLCIFLEYSEFPSLFLSKFFYKSSFRKNRALYCRYMRYLQNSTCPDRALFLPQALYLAWRQGLLRQ